MSNQSSAISLSLEPADNKRIANLCGQCDENLRQIEERLGVEINNRGSLFNLHGSENSVQAARDVIKNLYDKMSHEVISPECIHLSLQSTNINEAIVTDINKPQENDTVEIEIHTRKGIILGRGENQKSYLRNILSHDINFGVGPAGTGKTYLAVACAVEALEQEQVKRLVLVRPAVEAGEKLGFLPGDLSQKVDPYLRPLYDALYEMLGFERVAKLIENNIIEVAPLAFMRGRTLNDSFIILDEAQNTTTEQIKMFLTRVGFGSTTVITGDITQVDLPQDKPSGLRHVLKVLRDVEGISFSFFDARDVVRHPIVQRIVTAYEAFEKQLNEKK
ncbi:MAG: PhoH family protein [Methylococcales bacterium]